MSQYYHILHGTQRKFVPELAIYIICTVLEQGCRVLVDANRVRPSIYKVKVRPGVWLPLVYIAKEVCT